MTKTWKIGALLALLMVGGLFAAVTCAQEESPGGRSWRHFSERLDEDQDGQVTRDEFDRATSRFSRMDQNGDGVLTEADFAGMQGRGRGARGEHKPGGFLIRSADVDRDHEVTSAEWDAFVGGLDADSDGVISGSEMRASLPDRPGRRHPGPGAEGEGAPRGEGRFSEHFDQNDNGLVEVGEIAELFEALDANADGVVAGEELPACRGRRGRCGRGR